MPRNVKKNDTRFSVDPRANERLRAPATEEEALRMKHAESSTNSLDEYTEEQYNNFGWASYNGVLFKFWDSVCDCPFRSFESIMTEVLVIFRRKESRRSRGCNQCGALYVIRRKTVWNHPEGMYVIKPKKKHTRLSP